MRHDGGDPMRYEFRWGARNLRLLIGLPFMAVFIIDEVYFPPDNPTFWDSPFLTWGLIVAAFFVTFGRKESIIDLRSKKVEYKWGLLVTLYRKEYDLGEFMNVMLAYGTEIGEADFADGYPVNAIYLCRADGTRIKIEKIDNDQEKAESQAMEIARALSVPVSKVGTGYEIL